MKEPIDRARRNGGAEPRSKKRNERKPPERGPRLERMELQKQEIRRSIIRAAERLIVRQGFGLLTMDDLAREAQCSKATLYKYFCSKTEVVGALLFNYFERIRERLGEIRRKDLGLSDQLKSFIRESLEMHEETRSLSQALLLDEDFRKKMGVFLAEGRTARLSAEDRKMIRLMNRRIGDLTKDLTDFFQDGMNRGEFRKTDPILVVRLLSAAVNAFGHRTSGFFPYVGIDQATGFIHDMIMNGLAPRSGDRKGDER